MSFNCTMNGFVEIVDKSIKNVLFVPMVIKELLTMLLPSDLANAIEFTVDGLIQVFHIPGYFFAMIYYWANAYGYGAPICTAFSYINIPVDFIF